MLALLVPLLIAAWPGAEEQRKVPLITEATWLEIALKMEHTEVPCRELLGAPVENEKLLAFLARCDIDVESFRLTAERIRENAIKTVYAESDRTEHVLAEMPEMPDLGLPEGVTLPRFDDIPDRESDASRIAPELRCAQRLLDSLAAPLSEDDL